jgi:hypothetical protein
MRNTEAAKMLQFAIRELKEARHYLGAAEAEMEEDREQAPIALLFAGQVVEAYAEVCDLQTRLGRIRKEVK